MVIRALDHVKHCYTQDDGQVIFNLIFAHLKEGRDVRISFDGVATVPSSFVNTAFIKLLDDFLFDYIKEKLSFAKSTKQINEMIKTRFDFEVNKRGTDP